MIRWCRFPQRPLRWIATQCLEGRLCWCGQRRSIVSGFGPVASEHAWRWVRQLEHGLQPAQLEGRWRQAPPNAEVAEHLLEPPPADPSARWRVGRCRLAAVLLRLGLLISSYARSSPAWRASEATRKASACASRSCRRAPPTPSPALREGWRGHLPPGLRSHRWLALRWMEVQRTPPRFEL